MSNSLKSGVVNAVESWSRELDANRLLKPQSAQQLSGAINEARAAKLESPPTTLLTVLLLGPTGAGKSELLNALAGQRIAQSHFLRPTTTRPTIYAHEEVGIAQLAEYAPLLADLAQQPGSLVTHTNDALRTKILIDAPDIDSFKTEHRELVMQLLPVVDVALYVITPFSYKDNIGWQLVLQQRGRRAFAFVMNKWDNEGKPAAAAGAPQADTDFLQLLAARSGYIEPRLFRTSARYWLQQKLGELDSTTSAPDGDTFAELEQWLASGLESSAVAQIHQRRRSMLWSQLSEATGAAIPPRADWQPWKNKLEVAMGALQAEGAATIQPYLVHRASQIAAARKATRPRSYGVLGAIIGTGSSLLKLKPRLPQLPAMQTIHNEQPVVPAPGSQLKTLAELRLGSLSWSARELGTAIQALQQQWEIELNLVRAKVDDTIDSAAAAALARKSSRFKTGAAMSVLVLLELAAVALLVTGIWRVGKGYLAEQYVSLSFAASFAVLFLCLLAVAAGIRVLLFPTTPEGVLRELEKPVLATWKEFVQSLQSHGDQYAETYTRLVATGAQLQQQCANAAEANIRVTDSSDSNSEVTRLFATG